MVYRVKEGISFHDAAGTGVACTFTPLVKVSFDSLVGYSP